MNFDARKVIHGWGEFDSPEVHIHEKHIKSTCSQPTTQNDTQDLGHYDNRSTPRSPENVWVPEPVHELHLPEHGVAVGAVLVHLQHQHPPGRLVHHLKGRKEAEE